VISPDEIRALRRRLGWTQQRLAQAVGASVATVARWESGERRVSPAYARTLALLEADLLHTRLLLRLGEIATRAREGDPSAERLLQQVHALLLGSPEGESEGESTGSSPRLDSDCSR